MTNKQSQIQEAFSRLRRANLTLGLNELFAALEAETGGFAGETTEDLLAMLALIWCKSEEDRRLLRWTWQDIERATPKPPAIEPTNTGEPPTQMSANDRTKNEPLPNTALARQTTGNENSVGVMPTRPPDHSIPWDDRAELRNNYPITRRQMLYAWSQLRRLVPDGPRNVLDIDATIAMAAQQGFYFSPVMRRRERNHAELVILLDHRGSMVPLQHYLRDLVETALYESKLGSVKVYYFYNVPADSLYSDALMKTAPIPVEQIFAEMDQSTSVLIISDAGAIRQHNDLDRVSETLEFIDRLTEITQQVAWFNPMPESRWGDTSAQMIAQRVDMFAMTNDGLSNAVDVMRGLKPSALRWGLP